MPDVRELLRQILPPLRVEYQTGCLNQAAVGGFDRHLAHLVRKAQAAAAPTDPVREHLARLALIAEAYRGLDLDTRARRLREIKRRLDALLGPATAPPTPADDRPPARLEPVTLPAEPPAQPARSRERDRDRERDGALRGDLASAVQFVRGVGPQRARVLERLGITTVNDFLFHFPRRHEDRSHLLTLGEAQADLLATYQATIRNLEDFRPRRGGLRIVKAWVSDGTGSLELVWFNQPWLLDQLAVGQTLIFSGKVQRDKYGQRQITQPTWEPLEADGETIHTGRLVPIYPLTEGLTQTTMRRWIKHVLDHYTDLVPEILPEPVRRERDLVGRREAIRSFHFPESEEARLLARRRLVFEEFFGLQVALAQRRHEYDQRGTGIAFRIQSPLTRRLHESLPFELTPAQSRVLVEIFRDLAEPTPMNRLVQGDVGSGKTLVALSAMLTVVDNGCQAALMVPTEILAEQHHRVIRHWCDPLGVTVDLVTGRAGSKQRRELGERLASGVTQIAVGTHALIQEGVEFDNLGLVVVDEQHRFGVLQRKLLSGKGRTPDVLVMTATPIPRTLALTVYGELDTSVIDELPRGRAPITTSWQPLGKRREVYGHIKAKLREGRQAFVVCPLVEESEALEDVQAVTELYEHLQEHFKGFRVGMIHGRLKSAEKDAVMLQFGAGELDVLAATTVIEVGIDVPNASVMLIVNADRFGLAQLHQLRGRIGRGSHASECILLTDAKYNPDHADDENALQYRDARARIRFMLDYTDGFKLAEADLDLRGPGELGGTRQSGSMDFHVANLARDGRILEEARQAAKALIARDPYLQGAGLGELARYVSARFRERGQLAEVG